MSENTENLLNRTLTDYPQYFGALVDVTCAAVAGNQALNRISEEKAQAIETAARALKGEAFNRVSAYGAFAVKAWQAVTDAIAKESGVDLTAVRLNQTAMDATATATEITVFTALSEVGEAAEKLASAIEEKAREFTGVVKCGRLGLQDGAPVFVSTELLSYAASIREAVAELTREKEKWTLSHLGSGALGTGFGIDREFGAKATEVLSTLIGRTLKRPTEAYHALNQAHKFLSSHNALTELAFALWRLSNDLEFLSSGPRGGIRELILPAIAPGSSIMPGKINPTAAELVSATSDRVLSDHEAMIGAIHRSWGANGNLSGLPLRLVLDGAELLKRTCDVFVVKVISGLDVNKANCVREAEMSLALGAALEPVLGKEKALKVIEKAITEKKSIKDAAVSLGYMEESKAAELLNIEKLATKA